jgi:hypothetical protein
VTGGCNCAPQVPRFEDGRLILEAFDVSKAPKQTTVFKDPSTAPVRIYVNDARCGAWKSLRWKPA